MIFIAVFSAAENPVTWIFVFLVSPSADPYSITHWKSSFSVTSPVVSQKEQGIESPSCQ